MTETTLNKNLELKTLKHEVQLLRSFIISILGKDKEGKYNPKFVKEMLKAAKEKPIYSFRNTKSFLKELNRI